MGVGNSWRLPCFDAHIKLLIKAELRKFQSPIRQEIASWCLGSAGLPHLTPPFVSTGRFTVGHHVRQPKAPKTYCRYPAADVLISAFSPVLGKWGSVWSGGSRHQFLRTLLVCLTHCPPHGLSPASKGHSPSCMPPAMVFLGSPSEGADHSSRFRMERGEQNVRSRGICVNCH